MAKVPHPLLSIQASLLDPNPNEGHLESFHLARGLAGRGGKGRLGHQTSKERQLLAQL